jgi:hypothetical protein
MSVIAIVALCVVGGVLLYGLVVFAWMKSLPWMARRAAKSAKAMMNELEREMEEPDEKPRRTP